MALPIPRAERFTEHERSVLTLALSALSQLPCRVAGQYDYDTVEKLYGEFARHEK